MLRVVHVPAGEGLGGERLQDHVGPLDRPPGHLPAPRVGEVQADAQLAGVEVAVEVAVVEPGHAVAERRVEAQHVGPLRRLDLDDRRPVRREVPGGHRADADPGQVEDVQPVERRRRRLGAVLRLRVARRGAARTGRQLGVVLTDVGRPSRRRQRRGRQAGPRPRPRHRASRRPGRRRRSTRGRPAARRRGCRRPCTAAPPGGGGRAPPVQLGLGVPGEQGRQGVAHGGEELLRLVLEVQRAVVAVPGQRVGDALGVGPLHDEPHHRAADRTGGGRARPRSRRGTR